MMDTFFEYHKAKSPTTVYAYFEKGKTTVLFDKLL